MGRERERGTDGRSRRGGSRSEAIEVWERVRCWVLGAEVLKGGIHESKVGKKND